jgi:hypothetical protein
MFTHLKMPFIDLNKEVNRRKTAEKQRNAWVNVRSHIYYTHIEAHWLKAKL